MLVYYIFLIFSFGCGNILTKSFELGGVLSGNRMAGVPLGKSLGDGEVDVEGICQESGMACQNCTHAVTCVPLPYGWLKVPLQECPGDKTCNANQRGCSTEPVPECSLPSQKYQHTCEQVGIFPDAYDCRKFHLCSPPEGLPDGGPADHRVALCPRNYGYDPQTAQCSIKLTNGQCSIQAVPDCSKVGQMGVLATSPSHYFVCLSKHGALAPQIFLCPHGWYFLYGFCRPQQQLNREVISSTEESTTTVDITTAEPKTTSRIESFFSTDAPEKIPQDTFLADRFDLSNYNYEENVVSSFNDLPNSFEDENDFW
ncbi:unnamed protein product [Leptidea sinapis]|uniref:Chitin-binding type-2 domain-containing protein n=1 Tax=Leptidea sinapis TaxID=189913 RepID=A0A5E4Q3M0_9NEOP|nr:unnamed protein product [Leptidea sinapis]